MQIRSGISIKKYFFSLANGIREPSFVPQECSDPNERFSMCGVSPECEKTCANPEERFCPPICEIGCFCEPPFVRGPQGNCVLLKDCPEKVHISVIPIVN